MHGTAVMRSRDNKPYGWVEEQNMWIDLGNDDIRRIVSAKEGRLYKIDNYPSYRVF